MLPKQQTRSITLTLIAVAIAALCILPLLFIGFHLQITTNVHKLASGNWQAQYTNTSAAGTFIQTADDGFAISGTSADDNVLLIRTNASRDMEWRKTYGPGFGKAVILTDDGGFAIAGVKVSKTGTDSKNSSLLIVTDAEGNEQWSKEYEGNGFISVVNASDNGYVMLGRFNARGTERPGLLKVDITGNTQWVKTYSSSEAEVLKLFTLIGTSDGGYAMSGEMQYTNNGIVMRNGWFVKTDSNGETRVNRPFAMNGWTTFNSVAQAKDGGYMLVGATANSTDSPYAACLVRTDSGGHMQWSHINLTIANPGNSTAGDGTGFEYYSIAAVNNGNYDVTGYLNGGGIVAFAVKDDGSWLERHIRWSAQEKYRVTYIISVSQGVFAPGYAYIGYGNGTIRLSETYSYVLP